MAGKYRKSGCFTGGSWGCCKGIPLRGKMCWGVVEWSGHITGDQKGFHTSCGRLFRLIPEFTTPPHEQKSQTTQWKAEDFVAYSQIKYHSLNAFVKTLNSICVVRKLTLTRLIHTGLASCHSSWIKALARRRSCQSSTCLDSSFTNHQSL